jgi:hypothetical protein
LCIQSNTAIPQGEKPLREWASDTDHKVKKLENALDMVIVYLGRDDQTLSG